MVLAETSHSQYGYSRIPEDIRADYRKCFARLSSKRRREDYQRSCIKTIPSSRGYSRDAANPSCSCIADTKISINTNRVDSQAIGDRIGEPIGVALDAVADTVGRSQYRMMEIDTPVTVLDLQHLQYLGDIVWLTWYGDVNQYGDINRYGDIPPYFS